jgi:P4 family phage/plasmid primase-like protien
MHANLVAQHPELKSIVDTTIYTEKWFRYPEQSKEQAPNSRHIIKKGKMVDFVVEHIPKSSMCIDDKKYIQPACIKPKRTVKKETRTRVVKNKTVHSGDLMHPSVGTRKVEIIRKDDIVEQPNPIDNKLILSVCQSETNNTLDTSDLISIKGFAKDLVCGADVIDQLLDMLSRDKCDDYAKWIDVGMRVCRITCGHAFLAWDEWSKKSPKYKSGECKQKWKTFRTTDGHNALVDLLGWCSIDSPTEYQTFVLLHQSNRLIESKFPDIALDLGNTSTFSHRKCICLNNNECVFIRNKHTDMDRSMYIDIYNNQMDIKCRHLDCVSKSYPCPSVQLNRSETNLVNYGNVTINNYNDNREPNDLIDLQKFAIFENSKIDELVYNSLTNEDATMSDILYYFFSNKYNYGEDNNWYGFWDHKWHMIGTKNNELCKDGERKIKELYATLLDYCNQSGVDQNKIVQIKKINMGIGSSRKMNDIMIKTTITFSTEKPRKDIVNRFDTNCYLIGFDNGIYDLAKNEFREGRPDDYVTMSVGYDFIGEHTHRFEELMRFIEDIQPNKADRDYLLTYLSHALYGNTLELFTILMGSGRNGKSKLISLIGKTFGNYYGSVQSQLFTRPRPDANQPTPGLLNLRHKKIVISSEPEKKEKLNSGFIKFITGRDDTELRECHSNKMVTFSPTFITLFICNDIPETDEVDTAFSKRLRCINFPTEFCDNPMKKHEKLINTHINEQFDMWKQDFMLLLLNYYKEYMKTKIMTATENILMWTNQYKENTDVYLEFLREKTEEADDASNIRTSTLYMVFKKWFANSYPSVRMPSNKDFFSNLNKHRSIEKIRDGNSVTNGIRCTKIINDQ